MARELRAYASQNSTDASICAPIIASAMAAAMSTKTYLRYKTQSGSYSNVYPSFFNFIFLPPGVFHICASTITVDLVFVPLRNGEHLV